MLIEPRVPSVCIAAFTPTTTAYTLHAPLPLLVLDSYTGAVLAASFVATRQPNAAGLYHAVGAGQLSFNAGMDSWWATAERATRARAKGAQREVRRLRSSSGGSIPPDRPDAGR